MISNEVASEMIIYGKSDQQESNQTSEEVLTISQDKKKSYKNLTEIIPEIPGVFVAKPAGTTQKNNVISIRGFSAQGVKVLLNSRPMSSKEEERDLLLNFPMEQVEKIVFIKGPYSSSSDSLGGQINIITKKNTNTNQFKIALGSFEEKNLYLKVAEKSKILDLQLTGQSYSNQGDYSFKNPKKSSLYDEGEPNTLTMKNNAQKSLNLSALFSKTIFDHEFDFEIYKNRGKKGIPGKIGSFYERVSEENESNNYAFNYRTPFFSSFDQQLKLSLFQNTEKRIVKDPLGEQTGFPSQKNFKNSNNGFDIENSFLPTQNLNTKISYSTNDKKIKTPTFEKQLTENLIFTHVTFTPIEQLEISPTYNYYFFSDGKTKSLNSLGLKWHMAKNVDFIYEFKQGFRRPSFEELYYNFGQMSGNELLKNEESKGFDLGIKLNFEKFSLQLNHFHYHSTNLIQYQLVQGFQYRPINYAKTDHEGFEIQLSIRLNDRLIFDQVWTEQLITNDLPTSPYYKKLIPYRPKNFGQQKINYSLNDWLSFSFTHEFANTRYINEANTILLKKRNLFNFGSQFQVAKGPILFFQLDNLNNVEQQDSYGFPLPGRTYQMGIQSYF